ncbi:MAG: ribosomal RNA small subunit methyltransferase A [Oscillospiraceae bacterium]|nr:ribosomal RNA small subunit methyltransferase A [Oscillospiraceae bacterium]
MNLCDERELRALLGRHGFRFSKSMGQNFLIDASVPAAMADASGANKSCGVLEIGPGVGALTIELAKRAGKVVSVELDRALSPILGETLKEVPNAEIVWGDALRLDLSALAAEKFQGLTPIVCANLPYNITSPILEKLIQTPCFETVTVLLQKEVAERLAAPDGSADGGAFTLFLRYYMEPQMMFAVSREAFLPRPKVDSAALRCVRRTRPAVETDDEAHLFRVMRGAFLLRRKTLVNSLAAALPEVSKEAIREAVTACGLSETVRGERLTLQNFADLSRLLRAAER